MKKNIVKIAATIVFAVTSLSLSAQWNISGSQIFYAPTNLPPTINSACPSNTKNVALRIINGWNRENAVGEPTIEFNNGGGVGNSYKWFVGPAVSGPDFFRISRETDHGVNKGLNEYFRIQGNGSVIIGDPGAINANLNTGATSLSNAYNLYVTKGIRTEKIQVDLAATKWADFVFDKNYVLPSLLTVEKYIDANKHLIDIPSAQEVKENGINLVEMDAKLLQKIEELTLYMIDLKKQNDNLRKRIDLVEKR